MATRSFQIPWLRVSACVLVLILSGCASVPGPKAVVECRIAPPSESDVQRAALAAASGDEAGARLFWTSVDEVVAKRELTRPPMASGQLFSLGSLSKREVGEDCLYAAAARDLFRMADAYRRQFPGQALEVYSAYRSPVAQIRRSIMSTRDDLVSLRRDSSWSSVFESVAPPGYRDHQTGYAVDLFNPKTSMIPQNRKSFEWLADNAHRFGFELRYPHCDNALNDGQFVREPWHYLWKGVGAAKRKPLELDCPTTPTPEVPQPVAVLAGTRLPIEQSTCVVGTAKQVRDGARTREVYEAQDFLFFRSGLRVNTDGSPNSYHPDGRAAGALNTLCNALAVYPSAGTYAGQRISSIAPRNVDADTRCQIILDTFRAARNAGYTASPLGRIDWYALALIPGEPPRPCIQQEGRYKGFFVSQTHLPADASRQACDVDRWVDSTRIPYLTLPSESTVFGGFHATPGNMALVHRRVNGENLWITAVVADTGNKAELGEGSLALHRALGNAVAAGRRPNNLPDDITTFLFPRYKAHAPLTEIWISDPSLKEYLILKAGGRSALLACIDKAQRSTN